MTAEFKVTSTQSYAYQDATGRLVNGFRVYFLLLQYNETHDVRVPSLDPAVVTAAIAPVLEARKKLSAL